MRNIYAITAHHKMPGEAVEAWKRDGVCAVGHHWCYGKTQKPGQWGLFQEITQRDIILAYAPSNTIAYIGEVTTSKLLCEKHNEVGTNFGYWNQRRVDWWSQPHHFDRKDLPLWLSKQLGKRGKTIVRLNLQNYGFTHAIKIIKTKAQTGSALTALNEDMIKIGLHKYLLNHSDFLERGLEITKAEKEIAPGNRPDFEGVDHSGSAILIECKAKATTEDCNQLLRYEKAYRKRTAKGKARLMLVAFSIDKGCRKEARKAGIELVECELRFKRI